MFSGAPIGILRSFARLGFFLLFWLVIAGWSVKDLPVAVAGAIAATWVSLRLLAPGRISLHAGRFLLLVGRLLRGSFAAGLDVAWRALAPRPRLSPGFVSCAITLPEGERQNLFCLLQSLMPGTLPTGAEGGVVFVHALDVSQPVAEDFSAQERAFNRAIGHG
ncbi:multicomponent Na+:H+ antiporter subunit E [Rhodoblastus acidophilus]|uniref:Na+/H+ antiporter subunit E n=1 Tax=Rhodoblastus acidophilus TaxID=1074 RepID=UPI0022257DB1|nr:Na+/H+ antiporter subunit E [Rhodoblastus acidophilus]MCW2282731.1 multicomponent Na+:H+ antiporter subunit E [Rhodoblastus acidophilus]MCW2331592.1 multicomponent Na+:H+ antiporter subunit E [Rhodoblastus acidophilus]